MDLTTCISSSPDATVSILNLTSEQSNATPTISDHLLPSPSAGKERGTPTESGEEQATSPEIEISRTSKRHSTPPCNDEYYVEETPSAKEFTTEATSTSVRRLRSALRGIQTLSSLKRHATAARNYRVSFDHFVRVAEYNVDKDRSLALTGESQSEQNSPSPGEGVSPCIGCSFEEQELKHEGSLSDQEGSFEVKNLEHESDERNLSPKIQDSYEDEELRTTSSEVEEQQTFLAKVKERGDSLSEVGDDCDNQQQQEVDGDFLSEVEEFERTGCDPEVEMTEDIDERGESSSPPLTELESLSDGEESESEGGGELEEEEQLKQVEEIETRY